MGLKTREPVQKRAIETKEKLVRAASGLFAEKTYHGVNAAEICKEADVATGSFYHYFKNKMELFLEVLERYVRHAASMQVHLKSDFDSDTSMNMALRFFIEKVLDSHLENPGLLREMMRMTLFSDEVRLLSEKVDSQNVLFFKNFIQSNVPALREEDAAGLAWIVYYSSEVVIHQYSLEGGPMSRDKVVEQLAFIYESAMARMLG